MAREGGWSPPPQGARTSKPGVRLVAVHARVRCRDTAGQTHMYAVGAVFPALHRWPYDQFLATDFKPCTHDMRK